MTLNPDEKALLESVESGEWKPIDADEVARMRELRAQAAARRRAGGR